MNEETRRNFIAKSAQSITRNLVRGLGTFRLPSKQSALVALETVSMVMGLVDGFACLAGVDRQERVLAHRQFARSGRAAAVKLFANEGSVESLQRELAHPEPTVEASEALRLLAAASLSNGGCLPVVPGAIVEVEMAAAAKMPFAVSVSTDARGLVHVHTKRSPWFAVHRSRGGRA